MDAFLWFLACFSGAALIIGFGLFIYFVYYIVEEIPKQQKKYEAYLRWYNSLPPEQQYLIDQENAQRMAIGWFLASRR